MLSNPPALTPKAIRSHGFRTLLTKVSGIRDILPELLVDGVRFPPPVDP